MISLKECSIQMDQPDKKYMPGQKMHGYVIMFLNEPAIVEKVNIFIIGAAQTSWSESKRIILSNGISRQRLINFTANELYFRHELSLEGGKTENGTIIHPTDQHTFPFTFTLPENLPSSFDGQFGNIKYTIEVINDPSWKIDKKILRNFDVIPPSSLNSTDESFQKPQKLELEKSFCCLSCTSGTISLVLSVPYTVFIPGKKIPCLIELDNASNNDVYEITFTLSKVITFYSQNPDTEKKQSRLTITRTLFGAVKENSSKTFNEDIEIPVIELIDLDNCKIMDLYYEIIIEAITLGNLVHLKGAIPVKLELEPEKHDIGFQVNKKNAASSYNAIRIDEPLQPDGNIIGFNRLAPVSTTFTTFDAHYPFIQPSAPPELD